MTSFWCYNDVLITPCVRWVTREAEIWGVSWDNSWIYNGSGIDCIIIDPSHKSNNALDKYTTMHHFVAEICMPLGLWTCPCNLELDRTRCWAIGIFSSYLHSRLVIMNPMFYKHSLRSALVMYRLILPISFKITLLVQGQCYDWPSTSEPILRSRLLRTFQVTWWRHQMETFSALLATCAGNPVNSPHKGQWRGALMFSLICAWINGRVNNREAGDLRRHGYHYTVIIMKIHVS